MMQLHILAIGAIGAGAEAQLIKTYSARIAHAGKKIGIAGPHLTEIKSRKDDTKPLQTALATLSAKMPSPLIVALDESGQNITSAQFASKIAHWQANHHSHLCFVVGGADGLPALIAQNADMVLALGRMTWTHLLARALLYEQLWRALSILTHHPYHRG